VSRYIRVIGNLNPDLMLYPLAGFPAWGTEVITRHIDWRPGGISNVMLCLARLGVGASALADVGDDALGQELLSTLQEAGVDTSHIERCAEVHTGLSVGLGREDGERAFVTNLGHLERLDIDLVLRHRAAWGEAQWVLISGCFLLPRLGFAPTRALTDNVRSEGRQVLFDTGWDVEGWPERSVEEELQLLERVDISLPSLNGAQTPTGKISPEDWLESLFAHCPNHVIIKMGEAGSIARTGEGIFQQPAFSILPLDTTGAGDCFNAGIMVGVLRDWDIPKTLRFANALAALVISRPREEGYPLSQEIEEYLEKWR
jgi:sugar/nucleoside kinase (ribokinase family)